MKVPLDDFERRVRAFQEKEKSTKISVAQLIETFQDCSYLKDIVDENSVTRKLLTHRSLEVSPGTIYIPYLLLLGILLCASTKKMKAEAYYNMFKKEFSNEVQRNEILLGEFMEKMCDISYAMMIKLHAHQNPG